MIFNGSNVLCVPNLFNHSPTVEHLDCFPFVAIINDTVMNIDVHKPLGAFVIIPQVYFLQAGRLPVDHVGRRLWVVHLPVTVLWAPQVVLKVLLTGISTPKMQMHSSETSKSTCFLLPCGLARSTAFI